MRAAQLQCSAHPERQELPEASPECPEPVLCPIPGFPGPSSAQPCWMLQGLGKGLISALLCHTPALGPRVQPQITELFTGLPAGMDKLGTEEVPGVPGLGGAEQGDLGRGFGDRGAGDTHTWKQLPRGCSLVPGTPLELSGVKWAL